MKIFSLITLLAVVAYVSAAHLPAYGSAVDLSTNVVLLKGAKERKPIMIEATPVDGKSLSVSSVRADFICSVGGIIAGGMLCTAECLLQGYLGGTCIDDTCTCLWKYFIMEPPRI